MVNQTSMTPTTQFKFRIVPFGMACSDVKFYEALKKRFFRLEMPNFLQNYYLQMLYKVSVYKIEKQNSADNLVKIIGVKNRNIVSASIERNKSKKVRQEASS
jgi:hypothetical protein